MPSNRKIVRFEILITKVASDLSITDVQDVTFDGGNLVFQHSDVTTNNNPVSGVTRIRQVFTTIPLSRVKSEYFSSLPTPRKRRMTVSFDNPKTKILFHLNLEE